MLGVADHADVLAQSITCGPGQILIELESHELRRDRNNPFMRNGRCISDRGRDMFRPK